jgi:hypothetical protein
LSDVLSLRPAIHLDSGSTNVMSGPAMFRVNGQDQPDRHAAAVLRRLHACWQISPDFQRELFNVFFNRRDLCQPYDLLAARMKVIGASRFLIQGEV